jgi:hypothetical protein
LIVRDAVLRKDPFRDPDQILRDAIQQFDKENPAIGAGVSPVRDALSLVRGAESISGDASIVSRDAESATRDADKPEGDAISVLTKKAGKSTNIKSTAKKKTIKNRKSDGNYL